MESMQLFILSITVICISFSILTYIYLHVRKKGAEIITLKVIGVRVDLWSKYRRSYPVCLVIENGEECEVEFKKIRLRKFTSDMKLGVKAYRILKNDRWHYYSVENYYLTSYIIMIFPVLFALVSFMSK